MNTNTSNTESRAGRDGPKPKISDDEILDIFREADAPVMSTSDVAEETPITRRSVHNRLVALEEQGILRRMEVGRTRAAVWWLPESAWDRIAAEK